MDIFKIGRFQTSSIAPNKSESKKSGDRDAQGNTGQQSRRENPASFAEAKEAASKLESSAHFLANKLRVEVREFDQKYFLDVFDPKNQKIKTIGAEGIRAILSSYASSAAGGASRILDRRV